MAGATLAIVNGKVWSRPGATAVLVEGERITAVGADAAIQRISTRWRRPCRAVSTRRSAATSCPST